MKKKRTTIVQDSTPAITESSGWPAEVPILRANHFCRGANTKREQHDLGGWLEAAFEPGSIVRCPCRDKAELLLREIIAELVGAEEGKRSAIWEFNDDEHWTLKNLAWTWNEAMRRLGYNA